MDQLQTVPRLNKVIDVLADVGMPRTTFATLMHVGCIEAEWLLNPRANLKLSEIHKIAKVLEVPVGRLVVESSTELQTTMPEVQILRMLDAARSMHELAKESERPEIVNSSRLIIIQLLNMLDEESEYASLLRQEIVESLGPEFKQ